MSQIPRVESRFSDFIEDIHPKTWLSVYHNTSFTHIALMFIFYSVIGVMAATIVWSVQLYGFGYEEPTPDVSLLSVIIAGPFEETLFFGLPYAISGNTYVVLVTGAIWSATHMLNTEQLFLEGLISLSTFIFTIPHIFFSLRTWKSGKGWYAVILHSTWNAIVTSILFSMNEIPSKLIDFSSIGLFSEITNIVIACILIAITYPLYKLRMKKEAQKKLVVGPHENVKRKRSWLWIILPVFTGIFGGLISFFAIRKDDVKKARICLYLGIIITVAPFVYNYVETGSVPFLPGTDSFESSDKVKGLDLGGEIASFSINSNTNKMYAVILSEKEINQEILVIDGNTNNIVDKFSIDKTLTKPFLKIQPTTNFLYITDYYGDGREQRSKIYVVNLDTKQRIASYDFTTSAYPITFLDNSNIFYVNHVSHNSISVFDNAKNYLIKTIRVGQNPSGLAYNPNTNLVYSSSFASHAIDVIDASTHEVIDRIKFEYAPGDMEIDLDTNLIYVANGGHYSNKGTIVSVLDGSSHEVIETIDVGDWPNLMKLNPVTDMLYVQKYNDNEIAVIDTNSNKIIKIVDINVKPTQMDINFETNQIYLSGRSNEFISVIDGKSNTLVEFDTIEEVKEISY